MEFNGVPLEASTCTAAAGRDAGAGPACCSLWPPLRQDGSSHLVIVLDLRPKLYGTVRAALPPLLLLLLLAHPGSRGNVAAARCPLTPRAPRTVLAPSSRESALTGVSSLSLLRLAFNRSHIANLPAYVSASTLPWPPVAFISPPPPPLPPPPSTSTLHRPWRFSSPSPEALPSTAHY
ncbi:hypothetical protein PMIN01_05869 [Paraphaeosphaeria minitans]|uniref:Uncharacterized protein n=1 Tax=Paraphaeosphaeria minitans TaxID=565426 RepID=A0A9P6KRT3_9PLEO|nr:hypothetical protein PMIN01_05869 [Paraphaeosphaeria minitans]